MRSRPLVPCLLLAASLVLPGAGTPEAGAPGELFEAMGLVAPRGKTPVPGFSLRSLEGGTVRLSDLRGKLVLVNFWATWCPPCLAEMPSLERLRQRFRGRPFEVVAISIDRQGEEVVRPFVRRLGVGFRVLLDPEQEAFRRLGGRGLPVSLLVGPGGELLGRAAGPREWDSPGATRLIEALLEAVPARPGG